ncbi:MAG: hypothetical protein ACRD8W_05645, partial [Nitrososphaeraceae archaeon]
RTINEHNLQWRRDMIKQLSMRGLTQRDIASTMHISPALVNRDLQWLRDQAKQNIKHYVDEVLPLEYEHCLNGLNSIMAQAWKIALDTDTTDKREMLQALSLAKECYGMKLDLVSHSKVVERAVSFVEKHANNSNVTNSANSATGPLGPAQEKDKLTLDQHDDPAGT